MWKQISITGLIAGSLDILAAFIQGYFNHISPATILKFIASGLLGKDAYAGSYEVMALGLFIHFIIAFACVVSFFLLYKKIKALQKNVWLNAVLIGIVAWVITTQIIIPFSKIGSRPFQLQQAIIAILILIVCIGIPTAFSAKKYFEKN